LGELAFCVWAITVEAPAEPAVNMVLPDGCVDIVCDLLDETADFAAFSRATEQFEIAGPAAQIGVRMRPGVFHGLYGMAAHQVMDTTIPFVQLDPDASLKAAFEAGVPTSARAGALADYLISKGTGFQPSALMRLLPGVYDGSLRRVEQIADRLGYSLRQVTRLFLEEVGVSPRVFLNIVRLHRALRLLAGGRDGNLAQLSAEAGFSDQSHFTREIERYTGASPLEVRRRIGATGLAAEA
jgi:AraC-like DNA-binding protein